MANRFEKKPTRDGKVYFGIAVRDPNVPSQSTLVEGKTSPHSVQWPSSPRLWSGPCIIRGCPGRGRLVGSGPGLQPLRGTSRFGGLKRRFR
jgi:hypothetical protein